MWDDLLSQAISGYAPIESFPQPGSSMNPQSLHYQHVDPELNYRRLRNHHLGVKALEAYARNSEHAVYWNVRGEMIAQRANVPEDIQ